MAILLAREAIAKWDPKRISREDDPEGLFDEFPAKYLENARKHLRGEIPRSQVDELFDPLHDFVNVVDVANKDGFAEMLYLGTLLTGRDDEEYEREWFEVARKSDGSYRTIHERYDLRDIHDMASIGAEVLAEGKPLDAAPDPDSEAR